VTTASGKDLNELLVTAGMARIYGTRTPLPNGSDSPDVSGEAGEVGDRGESGRFRRLAKGAVASALGGFGGGTLVQFVFTFQRPLVAPFQVEVTTAALAESEQSAATLVSRTPRA
jgi:hypothetical protein